MSDIRESWSARIGGVWPSGTPRCTSGEYQAERLKWFMENGAVFRPVSGYYTKGGRHMWRAWADPIRGAGACELSGRNGNRRLFATMEAAQRACDALNAAQVFT